MSVLELQGVSRWFKSVVAVNGVTMSVGPGITGLLGPNGAGKSTILSMMAGLLPPSEGRVAIDGVEVGTQVEAYRYVGMVPYHEKTYEFLTGAEFVRLNAQLHGLPDVEGATARALHLVGMVEPAGRKISGYSKGMTQRIKVAAALVHDPMVLLLDEPFNGMDPMQRRAMMDLLRHLAANGRTIVFSSHILEEVELLAKRVEVIVSGRHAASGDYAAIRRLMTDKPSLYRVRSSDNRTLAARIVAETAVRSIDLKPNDDLDLAISDVAAFTRLLPRVAKEEGISVHEVRPTDDSLESVFEYLVGRR